MTDEKRKGHYRGGKGTGRRPPRDKGPRVDSPEAWRKERADSDRVSNKNFYLPWMPDKLTSDSIALLESLLSANSGVSSTAWVPMVDRDPSPVSTGCILGGTKFLWQKDGPPLPVCLGCKAPLHFVCQVDRASLLHPLQGSGLVQVFACPRCVQDPTMKPRAACWATAIDAKRLDEYHEVASEQPAGRRVVKWLPRKDFMHPQEAEALLNRSLSAEEWKVLGQSQIRGDKVGGFAPLLRPVESPKCKTCSQQMRLLLSMDSMDNVAFEWGKDGALLVFECAGHSDQVVALVVST